MTTDATFPTRDAPLPPLRVQALVFVALIVMPPLLINAAALTQGAIDPVALYRDANATASERFRDLHAMGYAPAWCCSRFNGAVSQLGVMVWSATAGVLALGIGAAWLRRARSRLGLLGSAFGLTCLLALDDQFMLHEKAPLLGSLSGEAILYPLYAVLAMSYLLHRPARSLRLAWILGLAGACLAASMLTDEVVPSSRTSILFEDAIKLFGLFFWFAWHAAIAAETAMNRPLLFRASGGRVPWPFAERDEEPAGRARLA